MRPSGRAVSAALIAQLCFVAADARAEGEARARLVYSVESGVDRCPEEREVKDAIAARLGYDPFAGAPEREVVLRVARRPAGGIDGVLEVGGPRPGHREIASPDGDCREVVDALAVAAAIAIDPASLSRPPDPVPPAPPPPEPPPPPAPPPARDPVTVRLALAPETILGELPAVGFGVLASGGLRWRFVSASIEGEATLPATHLVPAGDVTASLLTGALVPCGHVGIGFGCLLGRAGVIQAEGAGVSQPARATEGYAAIGARAGVDVPIAATFSFRAHADVVAPLTRVALQLDGSEAWSVPSIAARVAIGIGMWF